MVPGPSDASQVRNAPLHFNSLKTQNSVLAPGEMSALATRRGGYACRLPISLNHCLNFVSQIGVIRNYISQTSLLTRWKEMGRKSRVFPHLPLFTRLFYSIRSSGSVSSKALLFFSLEIMSGSFVIPWTIVLQTPLSMGFPRQEYQSGLPFPSPGDLPDLEIEPASPALAGIHGFSFHQTVPPSSVPGTS